MTAESKQGGYLVRLLINANNTINRAVALDCDSRRAFGPTKTIRGVFWTQLNRLERLAVLSALRERSFYMYCSECVIMNLQPQPRRLVPPLLTVTEPRGTR